MNAARETRLKPEFSYMYPGIHAGEWLEATSIAEQVTSRSIARQGYSVLSRRVLSEQHFEFRGQPPAGLVPVGRYRRLVDRMH